MAKPRHQPVQVDVVIHLGPNQFMFLKPSKPPAYTLHGPDRPDAKTALATSPPSLASLSSLRLQRLAVPRHVRRDHPPHRRGVDACPAGGRRRGVHLGAGRSRATGGVRSDYTYCILYSTCAFINQ